MTCEGQVFVAHVVFIDLAWETMGPSVIIQSASVITKLNAIAKICKYKSIHERHHFISMAMEVHCALKCDTNHFIRECVHLFHDR
jgi:hypothetical protein